MKKEFVEMYKQLHDMDRAMFAGFQSMFMTEYFKIYVDYFNLQTILDYGCGKGLQYIVGKIHKNWNIDSIYLYDIGLEEFSVKPEKGRKFDCVLCLDVMEHLEEEDIEEVIFEILDYTDILCIFTICTRPAKKTLPDGRNVHLTVKPKEWWLEKFEQIYVKKSKEKNVDINTLPKGVLLFEEEPSTIEQKKTWNYFINFTLKEKEEVENRIFKLEKNT